MPITIAGIRVEEITLRFKDGEDKLAATYSLMSNTGKVLAKQSIHEFGDVVVKPSPETMKAMEVFIAAYKKDITTMLGLED